MLSNKKYILLELTHIESYSTCTSTNRLTGKKREKKEKKKKKLTKTERRQSLFTPLVVEELENTQTWHVLWRKLCSTEQTVWFVYHHVAAELCDFVVVEK